MKVVHVIIGLNVGGAELMLFRLSKSFKDDEKQMHSIISLTDIGKLGPMIRDSGVQVTTLEMKGMLDFPRVLFSLCRIFRKLKPDIVQTWMYHADLIGGIAARLSGIRNVIWGIRSTNISSGVSKATRGIRRVCAILSYSIPKLIVCAADASRKAHVQIGYDSKRMMVIPNGFDPEVLVASMDQRAAIRMACGFSPTDLVIGSLGRYNPAKDHENFIAAASLLGADYPDLRFLLVGRDLDPQNKVIMEQIEGTGYSDRFVLLGERQDVACCLKAMDVFCLHSRTEGFPNVLGEAMAMGLPCVTTDVGDAAFLIGDTGVVVEPRNPQALADGLRQLVSAEAAYRLDLGEKAQRRVYENFTLSSAKCRFKVVYEQICPESD
ncbi:glycosyltransferase [Pseudomonas sp. SWRI196]|uniref:Glycosyltransferase n=1 Tax=Pseudomonas tehranensis TaxID=2745502 RepID=A0ABR6UMM7_9PSED|nr:glycosyltransferase [Pseudomonas tehranensis]MBC3345851.1 glycosyltransferase [Pseudomonas tehranensis]